MVDGCLGDRGLSLRQGTVVDATLIHAPSSAKKGGKRDPEMHKTKKGTSIASVLKRTSVWTIS